MSTQTVQTDTRAVSIRTAWAVVLAVIGLFNVAIGVAIIFGGAWTTIVVGGILILFALILTLPSKTYWG
jgi:hypothetical protein